MINHKTDRRYMRLADEILALTAEIKVTDQFAAELQHRSINAQELRIKKITEQAAIVAEHDNYRERQRELRNRIHPGILK